MHSDNYILSIDCDWVKTSSQHKDLLSYYSEKIKNVDEVYFSEGNLRIVSVKVSSVFLDGLTVDFSNDLIEPGYRLTNANAKGSCGCGSSFSTGDPAPNVDVSFSV